ncbi:hypothetical protein ACWEQ8_40775, partial [Streptomyces noursei]
RPPPRRLHGPAQHLRALQLAQGGGGLHRSRGGTRATPADPTAPHGKGKGDPSDKGGRARTGTPRPRYLDEDEPTPPREIPPSVIE